MLWRLSKRGCAMKSIQGSKQRVLSEDGDSAPPIEEASSFDGFKNSWRTGSPKATSHHNYDRFKRSLSLTSQLQRNNGGSQGLSSLLDRPLLGKRILSQLNHFGLNPGWFFLCSYMGRAQHSMAEPHLYMQTVLIQAAPLSRDENFPPRDGSLCNATQKMAADLSFKG